MTTLELTITVPDTIAEQAKQKGLLSPDSVVMLLERELERLFRIDRLFETADRLLEIDPPLTPEEIEAEIEAARSERRKRNASRS